MKGEGIAWDFFLAEKLHKTVEEIKAIPVQEYELWKEYYGIKAKLQELHQKTEEHRRGNS